MLEGNGMLMHLYCRILVALLYHPMCLTYLLSLKIIFFAMGPIPRSPSEPRPIFRHSVIGAHNNIKYTGKLT